MTAHYPGAPRGPKQDALPASEARRHGPIARFCILSWCLPGELAELLRRMRLVPPSHSSGDVTHRTMSLAKEPRHLLHTEGDQVGNGRQLDLLREESDELRR